MGRCADVPPAIVTVFRQYGPFKDGNEVLWALNRLAVTDKHKLLTIGVNSELGDVSGFGGLHHIPVNPTWDRVTREIEVFTAIAGHPFHGSIEFGLFIGFDDVPILMGEPVGRVLDCYVELVEHILIRLDSEGRRAGYRKPVEGHADTEALVLSFEDGSMLGIDPVSNIGQLIGEPISLTAEALHVTLWVTFVPPLKPYKSARLGSSSQGTI